MAISRRAILIVPVATVAGCGVDPTVAGNLDSLETNSPTQDPAYLAAVKIISPLRALTSTITTLNPEAPDASLIVSISAACDDYLLRLSATNPFAADPKFSYDIPTVTAEITSADEGTTQLQKQAKSAAEKLQELAKAATKQPQRLLLASLAVSLTGIGSSKLALEDTGARPVSFAEVSTASSAEIALSHVWALIYGLEVGLGRLTSTEKFEQGLLRMDQAKALRNKLRGAVDVSKTTQQPAYLLPNEMTEDSQIISAWGELELNLLGGLARLSCAEPTWLPQLMAQVSALQSWKKKLPYWPGWEPL